MSANNNKKKKSSINVSKQLYSHLLGKNHTLAHRQIMAVIVMMTGVGFVKLTSNLHIYVFHFVGDIIGYLIHGVGALPFVETILKHRDENNDGIDDDTGEIIKDEIDNL